MNENPSNKFSTHPNGLLNSSRHVYIGDSANFPELPAKNLTFTIMANAMRTKEDTQTDKEALISYLNTRSSAKNYLKRALKMKEDNTKSVEDLTDMFLDKLKE